MVNVTALGPSSSTDDGGTTRAAGIDDSALDLAVARVGDRWTLLIVAALLDAPRKFSELEEAIPGLAPNVLTSRLRRLEEVGLVAATPYSDRPRRLEYGLTSSGRALEGALRLLSSWGAHSSGGEAEGPRHRSCGTQLETRWYCPTCERLTDGTDDDVVWM
jgi:DNA-binding HxlR family transcriptional regulator